MYVNGAAQALAWRQWIMKRRGWITTLVEILSPIILVSMLVRHLCTQSITNLGEAAGAA